MEQTITLSTIIQSGVIIVGFWGFVKIIKEIVQSITARHDREQKWDEMEKHIDDKRNEIVDRYDDRLTKMEKKIEDNHTDTEAKLQQVRSELLILTDCMSAVLDGLKQLNCNGKVTEASENLSQYMRNRAHM